MGRLQRRHGFTIDNLLGAVTHLGFVEEVPLLAQLLAQVAESGGGLVADLA